MLRSLSTNDRLYAALLSKRQWMYCAQACCSCVLKSMLRCWTAARRATSAAANDVGLASIDWQVLNSPHTRRADALTRPTFHRLKMFGIDITWMRAFGSPLESVCSVVSIDERKLAIDVIAACDDAQTSLAPIRIVTSSGLGLRATALTAWALVPAALAPVTASLPPLGGLLAPQGSAGLSALMRRQRLLTVVFVPVAHELAGHVLAAGSRCGNRG